MNQENFIRRSINIPKELNLKIEMMKNDYSYSTKSDLIIELLKESLNDENNLLLRLFNRDKLIDLIK